MISLKDSFKDSFSVSFVCIKDYYDTRFEKYDIVTFYQQAGYEFTEKYKWNPVKYWTQTDIFEPYFYFNSKYEWGKIFDPCLTSYYVYVEGSTWNYYYGVRHFNILVDYQYDYEEYIEGFDEIVDTFWNPFAEKRQVWDEKFYFVFVPGEIEMIQAFPTYVLTQDYYYYRGGWELVPSQTLVCYYYLTESYAESYTIETIERITDIACYYKTVYTPEWNPKLEYIEYTETCLNCCTLNNIPVVCSDRQCFFSWEEEIICTFLPVKQPDSYYYKGAWVTTYIGAWQTESTFIPYGYYLSFLWKGYLNVSTWVYYGGYDDVLNKICEEGYYYGYIGKWESAYLPYYYGGWEEGYEEVDPGYKFSICVAENGTTSRPPSTDWVNISSNKTDISKIWTPNYDLGVSENSGAVGENVFGDGYEQTVNKGGSRPTKQKFELLFSNLNDKEAASLIAFSEVKGGIGSFLLTLKDLYNKPIELVMESFEHTFASNNSHSITISVEEVHQK